MLDKEVRLVEQWLDQPVFLCSEQVFVFVAHELLKGPQYGTGLVKKAEEMGYSISDAVLSKVLGRFREKEVVNTRHEKVIGRGRPRLVFSVKESREAIAAMNKLARYYEEIF